MTYIVLINKTRYNVTGNPFIPGNSFHCMLPGFMSINLSDFNADSFFKYMCISVCVCLMSACLVSFFQQSFTACNKRSRNQSICDVPMCTESLYIFMKLCIGSVKCWVQLMADAFMIWVYTPIYMYVVYNHIEPLVKY